MDQFRIAAAIVLGSILGGTELSLALTKDDYLRVSVECPESRENGVLTVTDANIQHAHAQSQTHLLKGKFDRIEFKFSTDGTRFRPTYTITRKESERKGEHELIIAFEQQAYEIIRLFCDANAEDRARYEAIMEKNRQLLARERTR